MHSPVPWRPELDLWRPLSPTWAPCRRHSLPLELIPPHPVSAKGFQVKICETLGTNWKHQISPASSICTFWGMDPVGRIPRVEDPPLWAAWCLAFTLCSIQSLCINWRRPQLNPRQPGPSAFPEQRKSLTRLEKSAGDSRFPMFLFCISVFLTQYLRQNYRATFLCC